MIIASLLTTLAAGVQVVHPAAAPGPLDNPLKGWCPYTIAGPISQPYSMVFLYVPWRELEPREGEYRFAEWEAKAWDSPLAKGKHIVFRVVADYPGQTSGVPAWLTAKGVRMRSYTDYGGGKAPDYDDPKMVAAMERLIAALGKRYDRNPRVAFVQFGLLGFWGEWHTYPREELFASPATQRQVLLAAHRAFPNKIVMNRYPDGVGGEMPWIGYFDDMFPEDTDGPEDWQFLPRMRRSGRTANWKTSVIGGEMVPHQAAKWLGPDFETTLRRMADAHFTWVGPYCPAQGANPTPEFIKRSAEMVRRMGYEFRLTKIAIGNGTVDLEGVNQGVAPFYYRWPVRLALIDKNHRVVEQKDTKIDLRRWLPGPFRARIKADWKAPKGDYRLALGILDPWTGQPAVGFANRLDKVNGWTILARIAGQGLTPARR